MAENLRRPCIGFIRIRDEGAKKRAPVQTSMSQSAEGRRREGGIDEKGGALISLLRHQVVVEGLEGELVFCLFLGQHLEDLHELFLVGLFHQLIV